MLHAVVVVSPSSKYRESTMLLSARRTGILGSTTNEVRGIESRELVNEAELRTARQVHKMGSVGGKQF